MYRMITAMQRDVVSMTLGEIHQTCLAALDKLCSQQILFENILKDRKKYTKACKKNYLEIKCKEKDCSYRYKPTAKKKNRVFINKKGKRKKSDSLKENLIEEKMARDVSSARKKGHFSKELSK